jgi:hypothetical protein
MSHDFLTTQHGTAACPLPIFLINQLSLCMVSAPNIFIEENHMSTIMASQTMVINHTKNKNSMQQIKITLTIGEVSSLHKSMAVTHKTMSNKLYHQVVVQHGCI